MAYYFILEQFLEVIRILYIPLIYHFVLYNLRAISRAVIIPFVKVQRNPIAEQVPYEKALDDAMVEASNSVGEIIRFGKALKNSQDYFDNDILPFLQEFIDDDRLLSTYSIALFAAEKVN